ncbi:MAG TPA: hypothetical protein VF054_05175 [Micromonosporaceae bacterium]
MRPLARTRPVLVLAVCVLLGVLGGVLVAAGTTPVYSARAVGTVVPRGTSTDLTAASYAREYGRIATDPAVLGPALTAEHVELSPQRAASALTVSVSADAPTIEIVARDTSAPRAAQLANLAMDALTNYVAPHQRDTRVEVIRLVPATTPAAPAWPDTRLDVLIGGVLGLVVGALPAMLLRDRRPPMSPVPAGLGGATTQPTHDWAPLAHARNGGGSEPRDDG